MALGTIDSPQTLVRFENTNGDARQAIEVLHGGSFTPPDVDAAYLARLGVTAPVSAEDLVQLAAGAEAFRRRFTTDTLGPDGFLLADIPLDQPMEVHNYTGKCPTNVLEVNPVAHVCQVGCLYCLVNDGEHAVRPGVVWRNYDVYMEHQLARELVDDTFFYFSPKSEAFQEPTLETGLAHRILRAFVAHFRRYPASQARIFIATKAGTKQLHHAWEGKTILDWLAELRGKVQWNPSIGIMPERLFPAFEPNAASVADRLAASLLCQSRGILSESVLVQPIILPFVDAAVLDAFYARLAAHNIRNTKPEFLTVCTKSLALLAPLIGAVDTRLERDVYDAYLAPDNATHVKQRERRAPDRAACRAALDLMIATAGRHGISLSICNWVRRQLEVDETIIPQVNANGYQCLGYQTRLFESNGCCQRPQA